MKIETCGWYKRRDGKKARVVCVDAGRDQPVLAIHREGSCGFHLDTGELFNGETNSSADLVAPWTDPEVGSLEWVRTLPPDTKVWNVRWVPDAVRVVGRDYSDSYQDGWHIVGTAKWANALPEGTKVRFSHWENGKFTQKKEGVWSKWKSWNWTPNEHETGWELYREPVLRAWKPEEVPVGKAVRRKGKVEKMLIISSAGLSEVPTIGGYGGVGYEDLLKHWELTNGSPCGVMKDVK